MKNNMFILFAILFSFQLSAQTDFETKRKFRLPLWTYHDVNSDIVGVSLGLVPETVSLAEGTTRTFGLRIEADPISVLSFLFGAGSDLPENFEDYNTKMNAEVHQKVYGLNISSGNVGSIDLYGISLTAFNQFSRKINGVSFSGFLNQTERANGILIAGGGNQSFISNGLILSFFNNETFYLKGIQIGAQNHVKEGGRGIQIGLFNNAKNFRGIQLGIWNKNDKRSFPVINWQFKGS